MLRGLLSCHKAVEVGLRASCQGQRLDTRIDNDPVRQFLAGHPGYRVRLAALSLFAGALGVEVRRALSAEPNVPERLRGWTGQHWAETLEQATEAGVLRRLEPGLQGVAASVPEALAALRPALFREGSSGWFGSGIARQRPL